MIEAIHVEPDVNTPNANTRSPKSVFREAIEAQPDDASYEEILRELAFEHMVERGMDDVRNGRLLDHDEALARIRSWQS